jgi:hypothetical protein
MSLVWLLCCTRGGGGNGRLDDLATTTMAQATRMERKAGQGLWHVSTHRFTVLRRPMT